MRAELVARTLLNVSAITSIVGNQLVRVRMVQNTTYPAVVYEQIDSIPVPPITANAGGNVSRARVQVTCLARTLDQMDTLVEAVRVAMSFKSGTIGGVQVISVLPDLVQPVLRDDAVAVFYQSADFQITHYEV